MVSIMRKLAAVTALFLPLFSMTSGAALACASGAKCQTAPEGAVATGYQVGDLLPRGQFQVLLNSEYYGLPPVPQGSWYFRVDRQVMRVRPDTLEILEDVTHLTNRAF